VTYLEAKGFFASGEMGYFACPDTRIHAVREMLYNVISDVRPGKTPGDGNPRDILWFFGEDLGELFIPITI
jgi:hypothetical protein